jgi:hypothetical protein
MSDGCNKEMKMKKTTTNGWTLVIAKLAGNVWGCVELHVYRTGGSPSLLTYTGTYDDVSAAKAAAELLLAAPAGKLVDIGGCLYAALPASGPRKLVRI